MKAYVIASIEITNPEAYEEYRKLVPGTVEKYGGRFMVRGGHKEKLEGTGWDPRRVVILEFDSYEQAKRWYDSEEYQAAKAIRVKNSIGDLILVEGI